MKRRRARRRRTPPGRCRRVVGGLARSSLRSSPVTVREAVAVSGGELAVVEVRDRRGVADQRGEVGGDVHLLLADADDQRAAVAGHDDPVREAGVQRRRCRRCPRSRRARRAPCPRGCRRSERRDEVREHLGVGVGAQVDARRRRAAARSAAALSMMPLWTTATSPLRSVCGCALASVAGPCVAQRVCPMPTLPGEPLGQLLGQVTHPAGLLGDLEPRPEPSTAMPAES